MQNVDRNILNPTLNLKALIDIFLEIQNVDGLI